MNNDEDNNKSQAEIRNFPSTTETKKNNSKLLISKDKWIPYKNVKNCFNCLKSFIPLVRPKRHCRICGRIFCEKCSGNSLDRDEINIEFHKKKIRVCDFCFKYCETYLLRRLRAKESDKAPNFLDQAPKSRDPFYDDGIFEEDKDNFTSNETGKEMLKSQIADEIRTKMLLKIDELIVNACQIQNIEDWIEIMQKFIKTAVQEVRLDSLRGTDFMDINYYIKIKKILWKDNSESRYVQGVVCKKFGTDSKSSVSLENPSFMIVSPSIDVPGDVKKNDKCEQKAIDEILDKIIGLNPKVIFVEKSVHRVAQEMLTALGITFFHEIKPHLLSRIARCTRTRIIKDLFKFTLDNEKQNPQKILGSSKSFFTKRYNPEELPPNVSYSNPDERLHNNRSHLLFWTERDREGPNSEEINTEIELKPAVPAPTLMFIEGCHPTFGVSLTISGPDIEILKTVKKSLKGLLSVSNHLLLEAELVIHDFTNYSNLNKLILNTKCCEILKVPRDQKGEATKRKCRSTEIFTQGNFQKFTDEKVNLEYLLKCDAIEYCMISLVKALPSDYNDIGINEAPNREIENLMAQNRFSPRWKMDNFSGLCDYPQVLRKTFYSAKDDISLGKYIQGRVNELFTQCETCKRPFYTHTPIYYYKNVYVKISNELTGFSNVLAVSEESSSRKVDTSAKETIVGGNNSPAQDLSRKNSSPNNYGVQTYIECDICKEKLTEIADLNRNFLEYSFNRLLMNFFLNSFPDDVKVKSVEHASDCCHVLKTRVFKYDEILLKFFSFSSNFFRNDILDFRKLYADKNSNLATLISRKALTNKKKEDVCSKFQTLIRRILKYLTALKGKEWLEDEKPEGGKPEPFSEEICEMKAFNTDSKAENVQQFVQDEDINSGPDNNVDEVQKNKEQSEVSTTHIPNADCLPKSSKTNDPFDPIEQELNRIIEAALSEQGFCEKILNENFANYLEVESIRILLFKRVTGIIEKIFHWKIVRDQARDSHIKIEKLKTFLKSAAAKRERREGKLVFLVSELMEQERRKKSLKRRKAIGKDHSKQTDTGQKQTNTTTEGTFSAIEEKTSSGFVEAMLSQEDTETQGDLLEIKGDQNASEENKVPYHELFTFDASLTTTPDEISKTPTQKPAPEWLNNNDELLVPELKDIGQGLTAFEEEDKAISDYLKHKFIPVCDTESPITAIANSLNSAKYMREIYKKEESEKLISNDIIEFDAEMFKFFQQKMIFDKINEERDLIKIKFFTLESMELEEIEKNVQKSAQNPVKIAPTNTEKPGANIEKSPEANIKIPKGMGNDSLSSEWAIKKEKMKVRIHFPVQFEALRMMNKVSLESFINSIAISSDWESTGGKSKASFVKSYDNFFIFKRLEKSEFNMFKTYALDYFKYLFRSQYHKKPSLMVKIYGCFEVHTQHYKHHYICMENLFFGFDKYPDIIVYDLKGSETNRYVNRTKPKQVLLDTNFKINQNGEPLPLAAEDSEFCFKAFEEDSKFLADHNLIDYSLLLIIEPKLLKVRMGIIDYLRLYTWDKSLEHYGKKVIKGGMIPTIINPEGYRKRFKDAMSKYFMEIPTD